MDSPSTVDDLAAVGLHREHQAGAHRRAVDDHGAGAAHAVLAADMGAGQPQIVAQAIRQRQPRLDLDLDLLAVDLKLRPTCAILPSSAAALWSARSTRVPTSERR